MKRTYFVFLFLVLALLISPGNLSAQGTEIPITTDSEEARETFIFGRQKKENIQLEAAEMLFNRALELDPEFALAYTYRGNPGDHEKAFEYIDKASEAEQLVIKYFKAFDHNELKEAKDYLIQLLEQYPSNKHVHLWAGLFYENILQNHQLALDHFYIASKLDDNYAAPHNEIGYRNMRLGNYEKAEEAFKKYIELAPECPNAFDSYANFLMKLKRYDESIQQYSAVYDLNPDKIVTIARIGQNYAFRGEYDEARSYYDKYFKIAENIGQKVTAISLSSASFIAEGNISMAVKKMKEYVKLGEKHNSNVDIILGKANIGFINLEMGSVKEGLKNYIEAAELLESLDLPASTRNRYLFSSYGWLSRAYALNNDFSKAGEYLKLAREMIEETNNPLYRNEYFQFEGYVDLERGKNAEAVENLLSTSRDDPYNIYLLAKAHYLNGENDNAMELVEMLDSWENFSLAYVVARDKSKKLIEE